MTGMDITLPISKAELARRLGISYQGVAQWKTVPAERVIDVARACDFRIRPYDIRRDLYPHPDDGMPADRRPQSISSGTHEAA